MHPTVRLLPYLLALGLPAIAMADNAPKVLATIKPLQLITSAITDGVIKPELLLGSNTSPHDYQMKPSDMKKLTSADLVIWVGPAMENFLVKPLARQDSLLTLQDVVYQQADEDHDEHGHHEDEHENDGHATEGHHEHEEHAADEHDEHHVHSHDGPDPHIWLSPEFAEHIAAAISHRLSEIDPAHSSQYQANLKKFESSLEQMDQRIKQQLAPYKSIGYFVFHDAYSQFENHYGLNHLDAFTLSPEIKPGAKKLTQIRDSIVERKAACVFKEPQFTPAIVTAITKGLKVKVGELDPLATDVEVSANGYIDFIQSLADSFEQCLKS